MRLEAAQGRAPFDLLLRGARIADVATMEIREADIGIVGRDDRERACAGRVYGRDRDA